MSTFQSIEANTGEFLEGDFDIASSEEIETAFNRASSAFPIYSKSKPEERAQFLELIATKLEAVGQTLVDRACAETGLPAARILGERARTTGQLRSFAKLVRDGSWVQASIDLPEPNRTPIPKPDVRKMLQPLGTVVVFGASNFPLAYSTPGGDTASALAAGNCVIVKGHPAHAGTSTIVANAIQEAVLEAGLPEGVFAHLMDNGFELGKSLVQHSQCEAVGFTGSLQGGRALFDLAAQRKDPIPVFAEMGSVNPSVFLPGMLVQETEKWAKAYAKSITTGVGQFCTNPGLMFAIDSPGLDKFLEQLGALIVDKAPATMLHGGISKAFHEKRETLLAARNVDLLSESSEQGTAIEGKPTIAVTSGANFINNPLLQEEIFGPLSLMVKCEDENQLLGCLQQLGGQLTATLIAYDEEIGNYPQILDELTRKAGRVVFNGVPTGVEVCPSMNHGGPYPATTDSRFTAVGIDAITRFCRPVCYQNWPQSLLPEALQDSNPLRISRRVNGEPDAVDA